ncbi:hypothetical protein [Shewanella livingstonensis]|uniref:Lipoprotein n=1 Tax=Shewanella livingstonensis TaxID=150120 RepID=A0A3G8LZJ7_9GAMM|nr:hypothetical protein [Shewanella livingstonensis]AZG74128.1 hypothetical protein EGC82_16025 [Shewanella livingstonensis]
MKKNIALFIYTAVITVFLSACGGGSDSDENDSSSVTPTPPVTTQPSQPMTVSTSLISTSVDELGSVSGSFSAGNVNGTLSATSSYSGKGKVKIDVSGNSVNVTFTAPEMNNDLIEQFVVTAKDSKTSHTVTFTANVKNTSAVSKVSFLTAYASSVSQKSLFADMTNIYRFYSSAGVYVGETTASDADDYQDAFSDSQTVAYSTLAKNSSYSSAAITKMLADYKTGALSETDIDSTISGLQTYILSINTTLATKISDIAALSDKLPVFTPGELSMTLTGMSSLIGNPSMGSYVNGQWVFNSEFALIGKIISSTCAAE